MAKQQSYCQLGNLKFRIDPDSVQYDFSIDYSVIDTLGGQVVQILGATLGDLVIQGSFGQQRASVSGQTSKESWELAEAFNASIRQMMDSQALLTNGASHRPYKFTYFDGLHDWDFDVLIKQIEDGDGSGSINHATSKYSYTYKLTLFIVSDNSQKLSKIAKDQFLTRISNGMGWAPTKFNGASSLQAAIDYIQGASPEGNLTGYLAAAAQQAVDQSNSTAGTQDTTTGTSGAGSIGAPVGRKAITN